jgi:hypothetical protein
MRAHSTHGPPPTATLQRLEPTAFRIHCEDLQDVLLINNVPNVSRCSVLHMLISFLGFGCCVEVLLIMELSHACCGPKPAAGRLYRATDLCTSRRRGTFRPRLSGEFVPESMHGQRPVTKHLDRHAKNALQKPYLHSGGPSVNDLETGVLLTEPSCPALGAAGSRTSGTAWPEWKQGRKEI